MKTIAVTTILLGLLAGQCFGQTSQALKRAREMNNQNNVRQGVTPPSQPQKPAPAAPAPAKAVATPQQKIQGDLMVFKPGVAITPALKQKLITDIVSAARGTKPSTATVTTFVDRLTIALADKTLGASEQMGLSKDIETVVNSTGMLAKQYDEIIDHVQAILQVSDVKRPTAIEVCKELRAVGKEVRGS